MTEANKDAFQQQENMSSDILALCSLLARIMIRCLKEKNPRVMEILALSAQAEKLERGETHNAI